MKILDVGSTSARRHKATISAEAWSVLRRRWSQPKSNVASTSELVNKGRDHKTTIKQQSD